jgi:hypothetical protein
VRRVIENASRRSLLVLLVEHAGFVLSAICGGLALLLLLGTQILDWSWILLVAFIGITVAFLRLRGRIMSRYRVAQVIDRRLQLNDTLSTAWFLLQSGGPGRSQSRFTAAQIGRAERAAQRIETASVFPFVWRRSWAVAGALAAVALSLFAVRYLVTSSLNFKPSLVPLSFSFPEDVLERIERLAGRDSETSRRALRPSGSALKHADQGNQSEKPEQNTKPPEQAGANSGIGSNQKFSRTPDDPSANTKQNGDTQNRGRDEASPESAGNNAPDGKPSESQARNEQTPANEANRDDNQQQSSGLLDRMKDALSGLMAKTHSQNAAQKEQHAEQEPKPGEKQSAQNSSRSGQTDQRERDSEDTNGRNSEQNAQGQQQAEASEKSPGTEANSSDEGANRKGSDPQSGIGRQDGEKTLKEAEQLRAMGKLDEIIGKRSANLTGDMTIETRSSNRPLETQYSGRVAHHADLGGEIDRDEVPLALQRYVREYMEQVRKQADDRK